MFRSQPRCCAVLLLASSLLLPSIAGADFVLIDNFDSYSLGAIHGQGPWSAAATSSAVALDPANSANQVLSISAVSTTAHRPLTVDNGTAHMLFFRFRFGTQLSISLGLSDHASPSQIGDFEAELSMSNASSDLRVRDGNHYEPLETLNSATWYNVWMLVDNSIDKTQIWMNTGTGQDADAGDRLTYLNADSELVDTFFFREGTSAALQSFFIKTASGSSDNVGPLLIDDIYLDTTDGALNLANPVPEPAALALALIASLGLVAIYRRWR